MTDATLKSIKKTAAVEQWTAFRRRACATEYGRDDPCLSAPSRAISFLFGSGRPRRLLYFTKDSFVRVWTDYQDIPENVAICYQRGLSSDNDCLFLK